jgi:photosystem II stability/assembly factor-like uncharacterized protein
LKKENLRKRVALLVAAVMLLATAVIMYPFFLNGKVRETISQETANTGGWQLQTNLQTLLNGRSISDMTFIDSVTGFAVTNALNSTDTGYIFKTTNSGYNWFVSYRTTEQWANIFNKIKFINDSIGYVCGGNGMAIFCKTTDKGDSWIKTNYAFTTSFLGMSCLNKDTIYLCDDNGLTGGVFRTTNGGLNWTLITYDNPRDIYMINGKVGFNTNGNLWKTSNGGYNWSLIDNLGYKDIYFFDSLTGYRITGNLTNIQKTTNGGINWISQYIPIVPGVITLKHHYGFFVLNENIIWMIGTYVHYPNYPLGYRDRGILYKTTNGGVNWGYQIPDTHIINIYNYNHINFYNENNGWAYSETGKGIHTITGGDSTLYVGIKNEDETLQVNYSLEQNYPNPFNSSMVIRYTVKKNGSITLKIYDIAGKEITTLINDYQKSGEYKIKFEGNNLPSGIYFYTLFINGIRADTKKAILIK